MNPRRVALTFTARIAALLCLGISQFSCFYVSQAIAQVPAKSTRKIVERVEPEYPAFMRDGHFEGRILAQVTVLANGSVSNVDIKGGNPMFATFASKALMKWKFAPGPDRTVEEVVFNFKSTPR